MCRLGCDIGSIAKYVGYLSYLCMGVAVCGADAKYIKVKLDTFLIELDEIECIGWPVARKLPQQNYLNNILSQQYVDYV